MKTAALQLVKGSQLVGVVLFIFAILGMQLFGNQFQPPVFAEPPRANFDSIWMSMITTFIIVMGEGWSSRQSVKPIPWLEHQAVARALLSLSRAAAL